MPETTVVLPYGGGPGTVVVPGADAVSHTELAAANYGRPVSTDGTAGLPTPSGVGLELVITATGLQDIRFNGTSL